MDPTGEVAMVEFLLLNFQGSTSVPFPHWCTASGGSPMDGYLPPCFAPGGNGAGSGGSGAGGSGGANGPPPGCVGPDCEHWTVRVDYRPLLRFKHGRNCNSNTGIPGCHLPLGFAEHSYVESD